MTMLPLHYLIYLLILGSLTSGGGGDVDIQGNIYVVDTDAAALVKYSFRGDTIGIVRGYGSGGREFDHPVAVVARSGNDVWVADMNNHRVQRFNRTLDLAATLYTRDDPDERRRFGLPRDIALTRQGDLLVIDGENLRVLRFDPLGHVVHAFGEGASGPGRLVDPRQIEVDDVDNIYVLDGGSIIRYDPFGALIGPLPLSIDGSITTFAVYGDTLIACDTLVAYTYALRPLQSLDAMELPAPLYRIRRIPGGYLLIEQRRAGTAVVAKRE